jgi:hypothetical protein
MVIQGTGAQQKSVSIHVLEITSPLPPSLCVLTSGGLVFLGIVWCKDVS